MKKLVVAASLVAAGIIAILVYGELDKLEAPKLVEPRYDGAH